MLKLRGNNGKINTIIVLLIIIAILAIVFAIKIFIPKNEEKISNINESEYSYEKQSSSIISQTNPINQSELVAVAQTTVKIASIISTVITIAMVIASIILAIGTSKLYGKLAMPDWTVKFTFIWPFVSIVNGFLPNTLNTIVSLIGGILGIVTLGYFFKAVGMRAWWAAIPFVSIIAFQFGLTGMLFGGILGILALIGFAGIIAFICAYIIANIKLGQIFNKSTGFIVGLAILPFIFEPILGFQKDN